MLLLLVGIGGFALYTVGDLGRSGRTALRANVYSVELGERMLRSLTNLDEIDADDAVAVRGRAAFRRILVQAVANVTEPGERAVLDSLRQTLAMADALARGEIAEDHPLHPRIVLNLRYQAQRLISINTDALTHRLVAANAEADSARNLLTGGVSVAVLLALLLVLSVPAAAAAPLQLLQSSIRHAAAHDFSQTIPVESRDEFGAVARDFNALLVQLNQFRVNTATELLTERNRLASVINTLDEGLLLIDQNRTILLANPVATTLLGLPAARLVGRQASEVAAENDLLRAVLRPLDSPNRVAAAAAELPLLTIRQRDGSDAHYRLAVHEIISFNPERDLLEFVGYILALHNVSQFKRLDEVKSGFLATVSHELKTPLTSIGLSLKLLQDERVPADERQRVVEGIREETQRLQRLVSELLDVARLDSGNIALDIRPVAAAELIGFATAPVQPQLAHQRLTLAQDLPADLPLVRADAEKAAWVLVNLLVNAIRYSPAGAAITLRALSAGDFVQFSVEDRGPGIAPENHERIFQRFAQLPDTAGHRGGSGLGLSIAREFIAAQGGQLWVESALGAGSTFHFTLPAAPSGLAQR